MKPLPSGVEEALLRAGGRNRYGEPNFRCVWGYDRLTLIGGLWEDRDEHQILLREVVETRKVPKYTPFDRWHIECWLPPEAYGTPEDWRKQTCETVNGQFVEQIGPYPSRGDYELCYTVQDDDGKFVQITPRLAQTVAELVIESRKFGMQQRIDAIYQAEKQKNKQWNTEVDGILEIPKPNEVLPWRTRDEEIKEWTYSRK